jgi:uncharacterized membrane-anchored protein
MSQFREHPLRKNLAQEVHARPYGLLRPPVRVSHLAVLSGETDPEGDRLHVQLLCRHFGVEAPESGTKHYSGSLEGKGDQELRFKWERHTEFSSYTFYQSGPFDDPFAESAINKIPADWLAALPGDVLGATNLALEPADAQERDFADLAKLFADNTVTGSGMLDGAALVWTDFRVHEDNFNRILIRDNGINQRQAGRLVQRILEVGSYRMMAMLAFPLARQILPKLAGYERSLSDLIGRMDKAESGEDERQTLKNLTNLAAEVEALSLDINYRFTAARAYHALVNRRIEELREIRISDLSEVKGLQPPGEFVTRRLSPAMDTCRSASERLDTLSLRIGRASDLLRTRVDVALEEQNRDLLKSMDKRAKVQLRLQETVEGLSIVAISYYLLGLVVYAAKSAKAAGLPINTEIATGVALPVVLALVWYSMRRIKNKLGKTD